MKDAVKKILKLPVLQFMYEPVHKLYRLYSVPARRRRLKKYGPEVVKDLADVFRRWNIQAFAAYGTMLGFVRDNGFIPHDDDMDIGVMPGTISPQELMRILLEKEKGFKLLFVFKYKEKVTEFKVEYKKIPIDFFFYEVKDGEFLSPLYFYIADKKYPSVNANSMKIVHLPPFKGIKWIDIFDCQFPVLDDFESALEALYGKGWRVPDKKWSDAKRPHIVDVDDFGYSVTLEEAYALSAKKA